MTYRRNWKVLDPPARIWLVYGDIEADVEHHECDEVTWCTERQYPSDVEYIIATELDRRRRMLDKDERTLHTCHDACPRPLCVQRRDIEGLRDEVRALRLVIGDGHPGYVIGTHWMSAAYARICAGEPEAEVLAEYGYAPAMETE